MQRLKYNEDTQQRRGLQVCKSRANRRRNVMEKTRGVRSLNIEGAGFCANANFPLVNA